GLALPSIAVMRSPGSTPFLEGGGEVFPITFSVHQGEVIVASAPEQSGVLPGDRITAIDGKANPIWLSEITQYISAETPALAYSILGQGEFYYFWLAYGERDQFQMELTRDAEQIDVLVESIKFDDLGQNTELEAGFELPGRETRRLSDTISYLRPGPFYNYEAETPEDIYSAEALSAYQSFIDDAFASMIDQGVEHLVLDLRDNPGGDSSFSDPVIRWFATEPFRFFSEFRIRVSSETTASNQARLDAAPSAASGVSRQFANLFAAASDGDYVPFDIPETTPRDGAKFKGKVHVLVNRYTYSNAVTVAALIQDYGFGTIYGEETRDMATTYGAMEHFDLPNSGFKVGYPKAHIIRPNGKTDSHPVTPDIVFSAPAIRGADDLALERLVGHIMRSEAK
ncbi:MAG: S41 family peptidase, partial [Pseudomonadota bacterium]